MIYDLIAGIDNYTELCRIEIDLRSHLPLSPQLKHLGEGTFYTIDFDIVLFFGLTEFRAAAAWKENVSLLIDLMVHWICLHFCQGVERQSSARIIYDPDDS